MSRLARRQQLAVLVVFVAMLAVACQPGPAASTTPSAAGSAAASGVLEAPPTAEELEAIRFRTEMSLEADLAHVRAVAADPSAGMEFGVPLLPSEFDELMSRSASVEDIIPIVQAEGAKAPNDYCGLYIDNANEGALTSAWKANRVIHEVAIRAQVRPGANVAFIDCRFSEVEVDRVCELIRRDDQAWMAAIPATATGWGCGNANFRVEMNISSAVPDAAEQVLHHYATLWNLPPGILVVTSDGTGAALRPRGTLHVFVLLPNGKRIGENGLGLNWTSKDLPGLQCGVGDVGYGIPSDGSPAELPCQAGIWEVQVWDQGKDDVIGRGTVQVQAGKVAEVTIRLTQNPKPPDPDS